MELVHLLNIDIYQDRLSKRYKALPSKSLLSKSVFPVKMQFHEFEQTPGGSKG